MTKEQILDLVRTKIKGQGNQVDLGSALGEVVEALADNAGGATPITYAELKALRNEGKLVAGQQYRITDYHCTTAQENTWSADHQFDIIVTADDEKTLNENARAIQHNQKDKPTLFIVGGGKYNGEYPLTRASSYDKVVGGVSYYGWDAGDDWIWYTSSETPSDKGVVYSIYDNERVEPYPLTEAYFSYGADTYFANSNLAAWELKYCLDNDTERFAWADNGIPEWVSSIDVLDGERLYFRDKYHINNKEYLRYGTDEQSNRYYDDTVCSGWVVAIDGSMTPPSPSVEVGLRIVLIYDGILDEGLRISAVSQTRMPSNGTGVIYYMKDEWNNECPYDFKNIQFKRKISLGSGFPTYSPEDGTETWVYTFSATSQNVFTEEWSELKDGSLESPYGHKSDEGTSTFWGNHIGEYRKLFDDGDEDNTKCGKLYLNDIVFFGWWEEVGSGTPEDYPYYYAYCCHSNTFGNRCHSNTLESGCNSNTFGNRCSSNTLGIGCYSNTFGADCNSNTFSFGCLYNIFGDNCYNNTLNGNFNTFGTGCYSNTFGNGCHSNTFGNECHSNTFGNNCRSKHLEFTSVKTSGISGSTPEFWFNGEKKW